MIERVGFIGLGRMGQRMAARLAEAGLKVMGYDAVASKAAGAKGVKAVASPGELAECDAVMTSVTDGAAVLAALDDRSGLLAGARRGLLLIEMSTIGVEDSKRVAALCDAAGVKYVRSPLLGTLDAAASGQLTALVSGPAGAVEEARPLLAKLCSTVHVLGEAEEGRVMKLLVNGLMGISQAAFLELAAVGQKAGLSWQQIEQVVCASSSASPIVKGTAARVRDQMFEPRLTVSLLAKDLRLLNELAAMSGAPTPTAASTLQLYQAAANMGWADYDTTAIHLLFQALSGSGATRG